MLIEALDRQRGGEAKSVLDDFMTDRCGLISTEQVSFKEKNTIV